MSAVQSVRWSADGSAVDIIDQRLLPGRLERRELRTVDDVCDAIATLAVRGAPAIGVAGAMGLVVALARDDSARRDAFLERARTLGDRIARVRPTAVNLPWAVHRVLDWAERTAGDGTAGLGAMRDEGTRIPQEGRAGWRRLRGHRPSLGAPRERLRTDRTCGA